VGIEDEEALGGTCGTAGRGLVRVIGLGLVGVVGVDGMLLPFQERRRTIRLIPLGL
jgi:hypothetical protein